MTLSIILSHRRESTWSYFVGSMRNSVRQGQDGWSGQPTLFMGQVTKIEKSLIIKDSLVFYLDFIYNAFNPGSSLKTWETLLDVENFQVT